MYYTIDPPLNSMVAGKIDMQRQSMYCLSRVVLTWYFYALLKISETNSSRNSDAKLNSTDPSCMHIQHIFFVKNFCLGIQTNWRIQHTLQNIYRNINMMLVFEIHQKIFRFRKKENYSRPVYLGTFLKSTFSLPCLN